MYHVVKPLTCQNDSCQNSGYIGEAFNYLSYQITNATRQPFESLLDIECSKCQTVFQVTDSQYVKEWTLVNGDPLPSLMELRSWIRITTQEEATGRPRMIHLGHFDQDKFTNIGLVHMRLSNPNYIGLHSEPDEELKSIAYTIIPERSHIQYTSPIDVHIYIFGDKVNKRLEVWEQVFANAIVLRHKRMYRLALIEYATAIEIVLEDTLSMKLEAQHDKAFAKRTLEGNTSVERRFKMLLPLVMGQTPKALNGVISEWAKYIQKPRNDTVHHGGIITEEIAGKAHTAAYQTIRWIQDSI